MVSLKNHYLLNDNHLYWVGVMQWKMYGRVVLDKIKLLGKIKMERMMITWFGDAVDEKEFNLEIVQPVVFQLQK